MCIKIDKLLAIVRSNKIVLGFLISSLLMTIFGLVSLAWYCNFQQSNYLHILTTKHPQDYGYTIGFPRGFWEDTGQGAAGFDPIYFVIDISLFLLIGHICGYILFRANKIIISYMVSAFLISLFGIILFAGYCSSQNWYYFMIAKNLEDFGLGFPFRFWEFDGYSPNAKFIPAFFIIDISIVLLLGHVSGYLLALKFLRHKEKIVEQL